jgi:hypothetical protein
VVSAPKWQITGTLRGKTKVVCVQATEWAAARHAVRISLPTMVIASIVMVDDRPQATRANAVTAFKTMTGAA